jgi:hypothetical protein
MPVAITASMRNLLAAALLMTACGTDFPHDDGTDAGSDGDSYTRLIADSWQLPPSTEKYLCVRKTVTTEIWISAIRPIAPLGTHHTVLMVGPADAPDGTVDCESALLKPSIYASGVGTQPFVLPDGVAIHLKPGDQLLLNLHLYNSDTESLTGTSGIEIVEADAATVQHEAGVVLAGKAAGLYVAPGSSTQTGTCTTPAGSTLFAITPHMHVLGTHMNVTYGTRTVFDEDYTFDDQRVHPIEPAITTVAGGKYAVTCSYVNTTGAAVTFGEHTGEEMCYALTFVYPPPTVASCTQ